MFYSISDLIGLFIGVLVTAVPIALVVWLVVALLGIGRSSSTQRDHPDVRAWDQGREIGRLEQEIADLRRRIGDLERRQQQPFPGD